MNLVVISPEADDAREQAVLRELFAAGLERYHVRKPAASREQLAAWLRAVPAEFRPRLVLHHHHDLAAELGCGGIHFRDSERSTVSLTVLAAHESLQRGQADRATHLTRSCHDLPAVRAALGHFDSIFVSPIFPSLSKPGHAPRSDFPFAALAALLATRAPAERRTAVLALGGVTRERLPQVRAFGFDGAAVLGAVWRAADPVRAFAEMQQSLALPCHAA